MTHQGSGSAVSAINLCKSFRRAVVLDNLDLDVPEGSVFGLIGPNGAGKTTTIKVLMNILKPTDGRVEILGIDSRRLAADDFTRIGYVSENQEMPDWMTVDYFLRYLRGFYPSWDDTRAGDLVRQFDLPLDRKLKELSRGMRMKASLVSSLAYHPRLLVLDEPFSGLDPLVRDDLVQGLIESAEESTILISSHDLAEIESFASHIAYLEGGRLQFSEEMASLTARFREVEVLVETPAKIPAEPEWPATWLRPEHTSAVVRFVETHFDSERTTSEIRRLFGSVLQISVNPMPLRAIFVTLARSASKTA
jgi:ABC-2 type transport system ATP-binding protein